MPRCVARHPRATIAHKLFGILVPSARSEVRASPPPQLNRTTNGRKYRCPQAPTPFAPNTRPSLHADALTRAGAAPEPYAATDPGLHYGCFGARVHWQFCPSRYDSPRVRMGTLARPVVLSLCVFREREPQVGDHNGIPFGASQRDRSPYTPFCFGVDVGPVLAAEGRVSGYPWDVTISTYRSTEHLRPH